MNIKKIISVFGDISADCNSKKNINNFKRPFNRNLNSKAFTLLEVLFVLMIISTLYLTVQPMLGNSAQKAKESVLKNNLRTVRDVISRFYKDNQRYPSGINELTEKKYLMFAPVDPITGKNDTWIIVNSGIGKNDVYDIKSGAAGKTTDNIEYSEL